VGAIGGVRLEAQLWNIANELRGEMDADGFRDYILEFIFYKYLSEKQYLYANQLLETETVTDYALLTDAEDIEAIKGESLTKLGYFLRPDELFSAIAKKAMPTRRTRATSSSKTHNTWTNASKPSSPTLPSPPNGSAKTIRSSHGSS